jgi:hypothetical protein
VTEIAAKPLFKNVGEKEVIATKLSKIEFSKVNLLE